MNNHKYPDAVAQKTIDNIVDPWGELDTGMESREKIWSKNRTFLGDVWFRFRSKPTSIIGACLILLVLLFALAGPNFTRFSYKQQDLNYVNLPPTLNTVAYKDSYYYITANLKLIEVSPNGELLGCPAKISGDNAAKRVVFDYNGQELVMDYSGTPYTLLDQSGQPIRDFRKMHNRTYLLGSDALGRDMLARLMFGARVSLLVAVIAALTNLIIGVLYGSISAYAGGNVDSVMMRIVDIINTLPLTLYVILLSVLIEGKGLLSIILALGTVYWVNMSRVVRGEILSLKERDFVLAARTLGSSTGMILGRHLIPNAMGPILVTMTMLIPSAIFMEAFLSFIGLGLAAPLASLGTMCSDALATLRTSPYQLFEPALLICILMFGFNFVGDGLRDALDPKLKK